MATPKKNSPEKTIQIFERMTKAFVKGNPKPNKEVKKLKDAEIALERAGKLPDDVREVFNNLKDKATKKKAKK